MKLNAKQLKLLKEKIELERSKLVASLNENQNENFVMKNEDRLDEVDQASSDYQRNQLIQFKSRDFLYIRKLEKALEKFKDNEYGICEECGCQIRYERLLAWPSAELCIACKDEAEREEKMSQPHQYFLRSVSQGHDVVGSF